jgi:hypothetical protein
MKCKGCKASIIQTHDWGTRGWAHYDASRTCSKAEPDDGQDPDTLHPHWDRLDAAERRGD